jgi:hypothetical protein
LSQITGWIRTPAAIRTAAMPRAKRPRLSGRK